MNSTKRFLLICCLLTFLVSTTAIPWREQKQNDVDSKSLYHQFLKELSHSHQVNVKEEEAKKAEHLASADDRDEETLIKELIRHLEMAEEQNAVPNQKNTKTNQNSQSIHHERRKFHYPHQLSAREEKCKLDVVILVDTSGSICHNNRDDMNCKNMGLVKTFITDISQELFVVADTQIAIISFSDNTHPTAFTSNIGDINTFVDGLESDGKTVTKKAISDARNLFQTSASLRDDADDVIILLTDGTPNKGEATRLAYTQETIEEAHAATESGIRILIAGVRGQDFNEDLLHDMSSGGLKDRDYYVVNDFPNLDKQLASSIVESSCKPNTCDAKTLDVALLVDVSGSICHNTGGPVSCANIELMQNFMNSISTKLMTLANSQISVVAFNTEIEQAEFMTDSNTVSSFVNGIKSSGMTKTKDAVQTAMEMFGDSTSGSRTGAKKVIIILTDGKPDAGGSEANKAQYMDETVVEIKHAVEDGVRVVLIGVQGSEFDEQKIKQLSAGGVLNKDYFIAKDFPNLDDMLAESIAETSCEPGQG